METKVDRDRMEQVCKSLNFQKYIIVDPNGLARGLVLMWKVEIAMEFVWSSKRMTQCVVNNDQGEPVWNLLAC